MWINFSVSENEMERIRNDVRSGQLKLPEGGRFVVEVEMVDGNLFPYTGRDHVRRSVVQPDDGHVPAARNRQQSGGRAAARINTSACASRARSGRTRSSIPQRAVQQSAKGHFVWVVNKR